jgi:hypothetical protein
MCTADERIAPTGLFNGVSEGVIRPSDISSDTRNDARPYRALVAKQQPAGTIGRDIRKPKPVLQKNLYPFSNDFIL